MFSSKNEPILKIIFLTNSFQVFRYFSSDDSDCLASYTCLKGRCRPPSKCSADTDCNNGEQCIENICTNRNISSNFTYHSTYYNMTYSFMGVPRLLSKKILAICLKKEQTISPGGGGGKGVRSSRPPPPPTDAH